MISSIIIAFAIVLLFLILSKASHFIRKSKDDWDVWDTVIIITLLIASVVVFYDEKSSIKQDDFDDYQLGGQSILGD